LRSLVIFLGIGAALLIEAGLVYLVVVDNPLPGGLFLWLIAHVVASALAAIGTALYITELTTLNGRKMFLFSFAFGVSMPLVGALGILVALLYGSEQANRRHTEDVYWQFTKNADLPFTAPVGRAYSRHDSRGFVEQLQYSDEADVLYKKVLAARNIRNSLSVAALKSAIAHSDERIRLTAYQTLDNKVTQLNRQIQRLEKDAKGQGSEDQSNTWLQISSNYWELLTLEKDEPVARKQLLEKASAAALNAVKVLPTNRNAHFTLGRIALLQGNERVAAVAFDRSMALGMPIEKAMPYRAEAAFQAENYSEVADCIDQIDDAFKAYPPLCHLAEYWA